MELLLLLPVLLLAGLFTSFGSAGDDPETGSDDDTGRAPPLDLGDDDNVWTGNFSDQEVSGGEGDDSLHGQGGDDRLGGDGGEDIVRGGIGDDTVHGGASDDIVYGGRDDDVIRLGGGEDFSGAQASDPDRDTAGNDLIYGGGGADRINDRLASNTIFGGRGADNLSGEDNLLDDARSDTLFGGRGDDRLVGDFGDVLTGGQGRDLFRIGAAGLGTFAPAESEGEAVTITDLQDDERVNIVVELAAPDAAFSLVVNDGNTEARLGDQVLAVFAGNTDVDPDQINLIIQARQGELVRGTTGEDILTSTLGDDSVFAGSGDDTVLGSGGDDIVQLGAGNDLTLPDENATAVGFGAGADQIFGGLGDDTFGGGRGADVLSGNDGSDAIVDDHGRDSAFGGAGDDIIDMTEAEDARGSDFLSGGNGNDHLIGDDGDIMTGGNGADMFDIDGFVLSEDFFDKPTIVTDFEPGRDLLRIEMNTGGQTPELTLTSDDDGGTYVRVNGKALFQLANVAPDAIGPGDIELLAPESD